MKSAIGILLLSSNIALVWTFPLQYFIPSNSYFPGGYAFQPPSSPVSGASSYTWDNPSNQGGGYAVPQLQSDAEAPQQLSQVVQQSNAVAPQVNQVEPQVNQVAPQVNQEAPQVNQVEPQPPPSDPQVVQQSDAVAPQPQFNEVTSQPQPPPSGSEVVQPFNAVAPQPRPSGAASQFIPDALLLSSEPAAEPPLSGLRIPPPPTWK